MKNLLYGFLLKIPLTCRYSELCVICLYIYVIVCQLVWCENFFLSFSFTLKKFSKTWNKRAVGNDNTKIITRCQYTVTFVTEHSSLLYYFTKLRTGEDKQGKHHKTTTKHYVVCTKVLITETCPDCKVHKQMIAKRISKKKKSIALRWNVSNLLNNFDSDRIV